MLRTDPGTFDAMQARALELGTREGGAIVSGILDAIEALDEVVAPQAIHLGLGWARGSVRFLALDLLAARDPEAARHRAAADPDQKVRGWTPRRPRERITSAGETDSRPRADERGHPVPRNAQAMLFPE